MFPVDARIVLVNLLFIVVFLVYAVVYVDLTLVINQLACAVASSLIGFLICEYFLSQTIDALRGELSRTKDKLYKIQLENSLNLLKLEKAEYDLERLQRDLVLSAGGGGRARNAPVLART